MAEYNTAESEPRSANATGPNDTSGRDAAARIEIGLLYTGSRFDDTYQAVLQARDRLQSRLNAAFGEFAWTLAVHCRPMRSTASPVEPVDLLQTGHEERDHAEWDFGIVVTPADLVCRYKPFALAIVSRSLDLAIVSLYRLKNTEETDADDLAPLAANIERVALHCFGHLNGLRDVSDPENVMFDLRGPDDLAGVVSFDDPQIADMRSSLRQIADVRLEEKQEAERIPLWHFYARSIWINGHEIADALWQAKPWEFPIRLGRLSAAAISSVLLLLITAETWDLALNQTPGSVGLLFGLALLLTTGYVVKRQRLLVARRKRRVTEQAVIGNIASVGIVFIGMATTAAVLLVLSFSAGAALFPATLVASWASSVDVSRSAPPGGYALMAVFVSSIGILIGALGASFEEQHHFRHVVLVDEEV